MLLRKACYTFAEAAAQRAAQMWDFLARPVSLD